MTLPAKGVLSDVNILRDPFRAAITDMRDSVAFLGTAWEPTLQYVHPCSTRGSDGILYDSLQSSTGQDPITPASAYWADHKNIPADTGFYDTIAQLRLSGTSPAKEYATVLGYYTPGDGGGGPVRIWKTGGAYVDNWGSVITPGGVPGPDAWVLPESTKITPEMFGAKGDGVTDDQAAFHAVEEALPSGTLNFTDRVYSTSYFPKAFSNSTGTGIRNYIGAGFGSGTTISYTGSTPCFQPTDTTSFVGGCTNGTVENIFFVNAGTPVIGLDFTRLRYWAVKNVFSADFSNNLVLNESWGTRFINCSFYRGTSNNVIGIDELNGIDFIGCHNSLSPANGWNLSDYNQVNIIGGITEGNAVGFFLGPGDNISIDDHYFEVNTIQARIAWAVGTITLSKCRIKSTASTTHIIYHDPDASDRLSQLTVKDCVFAGDLPTSGNLVTNVNGILDLSWKDNKYDFPMTELSAFISGFLQNSWVRLATDEVVQLVILDAGITLKGPGTAVRLLKPEKYTVKVIGCFVEAAPADLNADLNAGDPLVIPPPTFMSTVCAAISSSAGPSLSTFISTNGTIRVWANAQPELQGGVNLAIEYPVR